MAVAPDVDQPGRVGRRGRRPARRSTSRSRCSPRRRCRTATGRTSPCAVQRALPRRVDARTQRPVLRHHQPPVGADGAWPPRCDADRRDRLGQLVEHPGAREARPRGRLRRGVPRQHGRRAPRRLSPARSASPPARRRPRSSSTRSSPRSPRATASRSVRVTDEDEYFPPPRNIRDLQAAIEVGRARRCSADRSLDRPPMDDRSLGASDVLAALDDVVTRLSAHRASRFSCAALGSTGPRGRRARRRAGRAPARRGCSSSPRWCRPRSSWPGCAGTPSAACRTSIAVSGRTIS